MVATLVRDSARFRLHVQLFRASTSRHDYQPDEHRWLELARIRENLGGQLQALANAGGREAERAGSLEHVTRSIHEASMTCLSGMRPEAGRQPNTQDPSHALAGRWCQKAHQQGRLQTAGPQLQVGGRSHRREIQHTPFHWAETLEMSAPTIVSEMGAQRLSQHVCASLLMSAETGAEAHSIFDKMPSDNGLEAWRRLAQRFDSAPAQANLTLMARILKHLRAISTTYPSSVKNGKRWCAEKNTVPADKH